MVDPPLFLELSICIVLILPFLRLVSGILWCWYLICCVTRGIMFQLIPFRVGFLFSRVMFDDSLMSHRTGWDSIVRLLALPSVSCSSMAVTFTLSSGRNCCNSFQAISAECCLCYFYSCGFMVVFSSCRSPPTVPAVRLAYVLTCPIRAYRTFSM